MSSPTLAIGIVLALLGAGCIGVPTDSGRDELSAWTEALFTPPPPGNLTERLIALHARLAEISLTPYANATSSFKASKTYPMTLSNAGGDINASLEREALAGLIEAAVLAATIRTEHANQTCAGRYSLDDIEEDGLALVRSLESTDHVASGRLAEAELMLASRLDSAGSFLQRDDCRSAFQRRAILLAVELLGGSRDDMTPAGGPISPITLDAENWTIPQQLPVQATQDLVQAKRAVPFCYAHDLRPCVVYAAIVKARVDAMQEAFAQVTGHEDLAAEIAELDATALATAPGEAARSVLADHRTATESVRLAVAQAAVAPAEANMLAACLQHGADDCTLTG